MATVKFSNLAKQGCGILVDLENGDRVNLKTCQKLFNRLVEQENEEDLVKLIKCLENSNTMDNDLLTLQSSMILELRQLPGGLNYLNHYCDFLYNNIYKPWLLATKNYMDRYITSFESLCDARKDKLLELKSESVYKSLEDSMFLDGIKKLSVVFLILEYADVLSSYGYEQQASIVDKLNQILLERDNKFLKLAKKRQIKSRNGSDDLRGLPKIYLQGIQYQLGCNCLCNTIFILSFLRILAKNSRLGKWNDPRVYEIVGALRGDQDNAGHTFISVNLDPLEGSFKTINRFYIECTSNWGVHRQYGSDPLYKVGRNFEQDVFIMISRFLGTSSENLNKYSDRMYLVDGTKIYTRVVRNYLLDNVPKHNIWMKHWPSLLDNPGFVSIQSSNMNISRTHRIMTVLEHLKQFPNVAYLIDEYQADLYRDLILASQDHPPIVAEIEKEVKFRGQLLTEYINSWNLEKEAPKTHKKVGELIRMSKGMWKW